LLLFVVVFFFFFALLITLLLFLLMYFFLNEIFFEYRFHALRGAFFYSFLNVVVIEE